MKGVRLGINVDVMVMVVVANIFWRAMEIGTESWSVAIYDGDRDVGIRGNPCPNCQWRYFLSWLDLQVDLLVGAR